MKKQCSWATRKKRKVSSKMTSLAHLIIFDERKLKNALEILIVHCKIPHSLFEFPFHRKQTRCYVPMYIYKICNEILSETAARIICMRYTHSHFWTSEQMKKMDA